MTQMREILRNICPHCLHSLYSRAKFWIRFHFFRKGLISEEFRGLMGYDINWDNPQDLNEKINWMKLYGDTSEWPRLADKYLVREYVKERIGERYLTKLYGCWDNADDIDFSSLPEKFVLKTNHGCGTVIPIHDKKTIDKSSVCKQLDTWIKHRYGYLTVEPHYLKIQPVIYAEELIENDSTFSSSLVDYKVFCFSGKAYCILVCSDRIIGKHVNLSFYDCNWNIRPEMLDGRHKGETVIVQKPQCLQELIALAEKLAQGHPQVRVDFYISNNHIYFGEMTFTSQGGYMDYISRKYSIIMGDLTKDIPE